MPNTARRDNSTWIAPALKGHSMTIDFHALTEALERVHSPRLALRPVALSDAWPLFQATRNPLFNKHLMWDQPEDEARVLDRVDAIIDSARSGRLSALSAVVKATGEWVSLYRFQKHALDPKLVEMGLWTHDKFWQGRFSLELTAACVNAAFSLSDISTLVGAAAPDNRGSCRILELCGLSPASLVLRQGESGTEVELQEFQITREAWASSRRTDAFAYVAAQGRAPSRPVDAVLPVRKSADPIIVPSLSILTDEAVATEPERHPESNHVRSDTSLPPMAWAS